MLEINKNFRGLNLLDHTSDVAPNEAVIAKNLYPVGQALKSRPATRYLTQNVATTAPPGYGNYWQYVYSAFCSEKFSSNGKPWVFFVGWPTGQVGIQLYGLEWLPETGFYNTALVAIPRTDGGGSNVLLNSYTDSQTDLAIRWQEFNEVILLSIYKRSTKEGMLFKIYETASGTKKVKRVVNELQSTQTIVTNLRSLNDPWYRITEAGSGNIPIGVHEYAVLLTKSTDSTLIYALPAYFQTVTCGTNCTITLLFTFVVDIITTYGYDPANILVYRKDEGDTEYYYVGSAIWDSPSRTFEYVDTTAPESKSSNVLPEVSMIAPANTRAMALYQNRVVYATDQGNIWFSDPNNENYINYVNAEIQVTTGRNIQITDMVEYFGTLVIFTEEGIYHLTGNVTNDETTSTYELYLAVPGVKCLDTEVLISTDDLIYFLAQDGLYAYNTRYRKFLGKRIEPQWKLMYKNQLKLIEDRIKQLIYVITTWYTSNQSFYVYSYANQMLEESIIGDWFEFTNVANRISAPLIAPYEDREMGGRLDRTFYPTWFVYGLGSTNRTFVQIVNDLTTSLESYPQWIWQSKFLNMGTEIIRKRWLEARFHMKDNLTFGFMLRTDKLEDELGETTWTIEKFFPVGWGRDGVNYIRLKRRARSIQFRIWGTSKPRGHTVLTAFGISAVPVGRVPV